MKRPYEITVVFRILANDEETQNAIEQVRGWIEQADSAGEPKGVVTRIDRTTLGRRKLAYEIDKQRDGLYVIFQADIEPTHIAELELNLKLAQTILRHLIVRRDEDEIENEAPSTSVAVAVEPVVDESAVNEAAAQQEEVRPTE
jgi:small subunit ribosomal protein S6